MAVAIDVVAPSSSGQTTITAGNTSTWTHTVGAGSNRVVYVGITIGMFTADPTATTTAIFGGTSMTSIGKVKSNNQDNGYVEVFRLVNPSVGANTVSVLCSSSPTSMIGGSISLTGVDQSTPNDAAVTAFGNSVTASTSAISSAVGDEVFAFAGAGSGFSTINNGGTQTYGNNFITNSGAGCTDCAKWTGAASVTPSFTLATDWWGILAMNVNAVATAQNVVAWLKA